ncbi:carbohydrate binding family 9 domain-containing protein [Acidobacteria bacterium AH-259-D05]|nr:carbohydrate binding family 9 domain-containing protein [Acidobacteria bacterium AH-259-D05]
MDKNSFLLMLIVALFWATHVDAQESKKTASQSREVAAVFTEQRITVDGVLEGAWSNATTTTHFYQKEPRIGQQATEDTEVRILYNQESIYFAIRCFDSEPEKIIARERRRDDPLANDDSIAIILDTFHDHRNAFVFKTNPLGTQYDALITDERREVNANWDEKWTIATAMVDEGWIVEIEIPLKILRIQPGETQTWGIDFERVIQRKNEFTYWNNYSRDFFFEQVSQAGHLVDLRNLSKGEAWRIKPFIVTGFRSGSHLSSGENLTEVGLEDVKYRLTPGLTTQFTWNTDFAQTNVDDQQVNLNRFPLFFPEKREFFLEGLGNFEVGAPLEDDPTSQTIRLFFSRRIGLSERGEAVPILGGGRLSGRAGKFTLGLMHMQTEDSDSPLSGFVPANRFTVVRVKRDLLARSNVGMFFSNRDSSDSFNRVYAIDTNLIFWSHLNVNGFLAKSDSSQLSEEDWAASGRVFWDSDLFTLAAGHLLHQPNFKTDLGFSPREDFKKSLLDVQVKPRPGLQTVRQLIFRAIFQFFSDNRDILQSREAEYSFVAEFQSGDRLRVLWASLFERVSETFHIGDIPITPGDYPYSRFNIEYHAAPSRKLTGSPIVEYVREAGFWGGMQHIVRLRPVLRLWNKLSVQPNYEINRMSIGDRRLTVQVLNFRVDYAFNNKWLTSFTAQYNSLDEVTGFNFRLNYIYRPGDDFFVIYNRLNDRLNSFEQDGLIIKFTHSFDF